MMKFGLTAALWAGLSLHAHAQTLPFTHSNLSKGGADKSDRSAIMDTTDDGAHEVLTTRTMLAQGGAFPTPGLGVVSLDEEGKYVTHGITSPAYSTYTDVQNLLGYERNGEKFLLTLTSDGQLNSLAINPSNILNQPQLGPTLLIEDLVPTIGTQHIDGKYIFPIFKEDEETGDILLAGQNLDFGLFTPQSGHLFLYSPTSSSTNDPATFNKSHLALGDNIIDIKKADLDMNGVDDRYIVLTEKITYTFGPFSNRTCEYKVYQVDVVSNALVLAGVQDLIQSVGCGHKATAIATIDLVDAAQSNFQDYVVAVANKSGSGLGSYTYTELWVYEGDGTPQFNNFSNWILYPPNSSALISNFIDSIEVKDIDENGEKDLVFLQSFVNPSYGQSTSPHLPAEVHFVLNPTPYSSTSPFQLSLPLQTLALNSFVEPSLSTSDTPTFFNTPYHSTPQRLRFVDLGLDENMDLMVMGTFTINTNINPHKYSYGLETFRNTNGFKLNTAGHRKRAEGSAIYPISYTPKLGFGGGRPTLGNSNYKLRLLNVPVNKVYAFNFGTQVVPNYLPFHGGFVYHLGGTWVLGSIAVTQPVGVSGMGYGEYSLPIPNSTAFIGVFGGFQAVYSDGGNAIATHALEVQIGY